MIDTGLLLKIIGGWFLLSAPISLGVAWILGRLSGEAPVEDTERDERVITATMPVVQAQ